MAEELRNDLKVSRTPSVEDRKKRYAALAIVLSKYFQKWSEVFRTHEVTKMQTLYYVEMLADIPVQDVERACQVISREGVSGLFNEPAQFPKPEHIRKCYQLRFAGHEEAFLGPKMIDWKDNVLTQEQRDEIALACRKNLGYRVEVSRPRATQKKKLAIKMSSMTIEEQKAELKRRGYLK